MPQRRDLTALRFAIFAFLATLAALAAAPRALAQASVTAVVSGTHHSCAVMPDSTVKCWGRNTEGQLGDGSNTTTSTPVTVSGLSNVVSVALGADFSCALTLAGGVKCWGFNGNGELGDNSQTNTNIPGDVSGLTSGVAAIAAGENHACALTVGGGVKCWGKNDLRQLGDGTTDPFKLVPTDVTGLSSGVLSIVTRQVHTCAVLQNGSARCWGRNTDAQLGSTSTFGNGPVTVTAVSGTITAMATGHGHTCALVNGGVKCWGRNFEGQLGNGNNSATTSGVDVSGLTSGVASITAAWNNSCAITTTGVAKCWGDQSLGQLGNGQSGALTSVNTPVDVLGLVGSAAQISAAYQHICVRTIGGSVRCAGDNIDGRLGNGASLTPTPPGATSTPVSVVGLTASVAGSQVATGGRHACLLTSTGGVMCWGRNAEGQLGDGNGGADRQFPVAVTGLSSGVTAITAGTDHTCAVVSGGVKCWGSNAGGQLGVGGGNQLSPVDVATLGASSGVTAVAAGESHTCALVSGGAKCWGDNTFAQLGDGGNTSRSAPADVSGLTTGVTGIASGRWHACALDGSGGAKCWGRNDFGQLGIGSTGPAGGVTTPTSVAGAGSSITAITGGGLHTCAISSGGAKCWGRNDTGQLGNNSTTDATTSPVDVTGLATDIASIAAGREHTCAVTSTGVGKCWGRNDHGQMGNGSVSTNVLTAVDASGFAGTVASMSAGGQHTCAITTGGWTRCWGWNSAGELGDGSFTERTSQAETMLRSQFLTFSPVATVPFGNTTSLTATASSGLGVTFETWTPSVCSVSGGAVTPSAFGLCGVRASQAGNSSFHAAPAQRHLRIVVKGEQVIVFTSPGTKTFGDAPFALTVTGGGSVEPVVLTSLTTSICTISGNTVTIVAAGTCTIAGNQAGDTNYNPAPQATLNITINLANQTITFGAQGGQTYAPSGTFAISPVATASSGLAVAHSSTTTGVCTVSGTTVTIVASGTCTIAANQGGNGNYNPAPQVTQDVAIAKANQAITFNALSDKILGDPPFTVSATAAITPVTFTSQTTSVCTSTGTNGATITLLTLGTCTIAADQAGNGNYNPAPQVTRSFLVKDGTPPETTLDSAPPVNSNSATANFTFSSNEAGTFECSLDSPTAFTVCTSPKQYTSLPEGVHVFRVRALDTASPPNVDASPATHTWTVDLTSPSLTITSKPAINAANQAAYSISGACNEAGRTVNAQIGALATTATCGSPVAGQYTTAAVNASGLAQGPVALQVTLNDAAGNSTTVNDSTTKDTVAPTVTLDTLDVITNGNKASYGFSGTCETGSSVVSWTITGGASLNGTKPCSAGAFVVSGLDVTSLTDGTVSFQATQSDTAGNPTTANGSVLKDTVNPLVTFDTAVPINNANKASYTLSGTCSENTRTVSVTVGGTVNPTPTCTGGAWNAPGLNLTAIGDSAAVALNAVHTDAAGNSANAGTTVLKDTAAPAAPSVTAPSGTIFNAQPTVTGTAEANSSVAVRIDGTQVGTTSANGSGSWSFPLASALAVGAHTAGATATDAAGNPSPASTLANFYVAPTVVVSPTTLPGGTVAVAYSQAVSASGGTAPYTFAVTAGALPGGLTLAAGGALSGTPNATGTFNFTVTATDANTVNGPFTGARAYSIVIAQSGQSITFGAQGGQTYAPGGTFAINPLASASSGLAVAYSSLTTGVCTVSGTTVAIVAAGTCTLAANQAGNANFGPAAQVTQNVAIAKASQAITFGAQAGQSYAPGGTFAINPLATASSGLAVAYSSATPSVCTVSGSTVAIVAVGTCTIAANQGGNVNYNAAAQATQNVAIAATVPGAPSIGTGSPGNGQASIAFSAPSNNGGDPIIDYRATCNPGGLTQVAGASPITVTGLANGTAYSCSVTARNSAGTGPASGSVSVTPRILQVIISPSSIDFGGQSMGTTSPAQAVTITNDTSVAISISSVSGGAQFPVSHNCASVAPQQSCSAQVAFQPAVSNVALTEAVAVMGTLSVTSNASGSPHTIPLAGSAEKSLVTHYYRSILRRAPDPGGKTFWHNEAVRVAGLGPSVAEVWFAMSTVFYASAEYAAFNSDTNGFVTDLYNTFFNRAPDPGGLSFWAGLINSGLPREVALTSFMFSPEFAAFNTAIFGTSSARAEVNAVVDFYRGLLSRLPDSGGLNFWVNRFRTAQCQGQAAIVAEVEAISSAFTLSPEYTGRNRTNTQYVGDLYNAFLRRGGDLGGVQFWINQIATGARSREQVRIDFKNSSEFQARVQAIIQQGCQP